MKKSKNADFSHTGSSSRGKNLLFSTLFGTVTGVLSFVILILLFGGICLMTQNPHGLLLPLGFCAVYMSAAIGGFASVKRNKNCDILPIGAMCGAVYMLLLWGGLAAVRAFFSIEASPSLSSFILKLAVILASISGSFVAGAVRPSKPKRKF